MVSLFTWFRDNPLSSNTISAIFVYSPVRECQIWGDFIIYSERYKTRRTELWLTDICIQVTNFFIPPEKNVEGVAGKGGVESPLACCRRRAFSRARVVKFMVVDGIITGDTCLTSSAVTLGHLSHIFCSNTKTSLGSCYRFRLNFPYFRTVMHVHPEMVAKQECRESCHKYMGERSLL
ncbi:hypothetical protein ACFX13_021738 [Malus domestica]